MVQKQKFKNTTKKECIYGWYPPAETQIVNETSKDVYSNLGSRAPKPQSNLGILDSVKKKPQLNFISFCRSSNFV